MRSFIAGLAMLASTPVVTLAAPLPLQDGAYTRGACNGGRVENSDSLGIYTRKHGSPRGSRFLSPAAEGKIGYCTPGRIKVSGDTYSGTAPCTLGAKLDLPDGSYRFAYQVVDQRTFVSRGATYRWCAEHR